MAEVTRVVRSGLSYNLLCSRCEEIIRHDVRTERAAFHNVRRVTGHLEVCSGIKKTWWRKVLARRKGKR